MPSISVIMPCHNRADDLPRVLDAYDHQRGSPSFELIAIDDGSVDRTFEILTSHKPINYSIIPVRQEQNRGPAVARNVGIDRAAAPLLLFVGDDVRPDPYLVSGHLAAHRQNPRPETAFLGRITWPEDLPINTVMKHIEGLGAEQFSYYYLRDAREYDFRHFYTANISVKRELLNTQTKWFDEEFPYAVFEDIELSYRLSQAGMRIIYSAVLVGFHYHYHNIWTFSSRHFKAGLMACLVARKQPHTRRFLLGRNWRMRLLQLRLLSSIGSSSETSTEDLENQMLHAVSRFEWTPHPLLDRLYLRLFGYFYFKGMIFGLVSDKADAERLSQVFANRSLPPLISRVSRWD